MSSSDEVKILPSIDEPVPKKEKTGTLAQQKATEAVENLPPEDKAALFFNMYGHKLHAYLTNMSLKQVRRAFMNALGNRDPLYNPRTQEEKFVAWAAEKLVEIKMTMQMHTLNEKIKTAEAEYEASKGLEDKLIEDASNTKQEGNTNGN